MYNYGKVYLVGSGPGDERLITVGAVECLKKADVVIYDNLINEHVLSKYCDARCEKIYVGKSGAHHTLEQDGINELIAEKARTHMRGTPQGRRSVYLRQGRRRGALP